MLVLQYNAAARFICWFPPLTLIVLRKYVSAYSTEELLSKHYRVIRSYANTCRMGIEIVALRKKTPIRRSEAQATGARRAGDSTDEKPVALTLKVDHGTYIRLCTLGATQRRTNQDILKQALDEYLDRARS